MGGRKTASVQPATRIRVAWMTLAWLVAFVPHDVSAQEFSWAKRVGGQGNEGGYSIAVDGTGNVYTTGSFSDTADFDPGPGTFNLSPASIHTFDIFVSKFDPEGNFVWAKQLGGFGADYSFAIAVDGAGNAYTTGQFYGVADFDPGPTTYNLGVGGHTGVFVSKLDTAGNFVWAKQLGAGASYCIGDSIAVDTAGNVYAAGTFSGTADFDPGPGAFSMTANATGAVTFVAKLDAGGGFVWAKQLGGGSRSSVQVDSSGNVVTTGQLWAMGDFDPGDGTYELGPSGVFISKLDGSGDFVSARQFGGDQSVPNSVVVDGSGSVYTTGSFVGTRDFDPGPGIYNLTAAGADVFVLKLDGAGNFVWAKQIGGADADSAYGLTVDGAGNVYAAGVFEGIADFDPGPNTFNLQTQGSDSGFVVKLDTAGNFVWAGQMGGPNAPVAVNGIAVDGNGSVVTTGTFIKTVDFDPGPSTSFSLTATGNPNGYGDFFVTKFVQRPSMAFTNRTTLTWTPVGGGLYNVYRSDSTLPGTFFCFASHQVVAHATDLDDPAIGALYAYLVTTVTAAGPEGSLGFESVGLTQTTERPNSNPCP